MTRVNFLDIALNVLSKENREMKPSEICQIAIEKGLLVEFGRTPEATMRACLNRAWKNHDSRLVKEGSKYKLA